MPTYMRKDDYGYRFLRPIPQDLRPLFKKANFVKRLGRDYKKAKELCALLTVQTDRELAAARSNQKQVTSTDSFLKLPRETRLKRLSISPELPGQIASLFLSTLDADAQARKEGMSDEEFESLDANIQEMLPLINRAVASGNVGKFHEFVNQLMVFRGYQLEATDAQWQALTYEVLTHVQTGYKTLAARQQGESLGQPDISKLPPPLEAVWDAQPDRAANPQVNRLADITPHYKRYLSPKYPKTQSTYLSIWQRFVDFAENKPLHLVGSDDVYNFLESRLQDKEAAWSYKYVAGRVKRALHTAFGIGKTKKLINNNPVVELDVMPTVDAKQEKLRQKPRFPYQPNHLNKLFASDWYNPSSSAWRGKMKDDLGARYWIPLVCMWHGLRVSEAAQLQVEDVILEELTLLIHDGKTEFGPDRSLKNEESMRIVPIHPVLIEQGFIDFVRSIMNHYSKGPLFPAALPECDGKSPKWGRAYEQPFVRFVRDKLGFGSGYGNHSFRHSLEDRIRAANVEDVWPKGLAQAYTGRASVRPKDAGKIEEEGSESLYGDGYEIEAFRRYIQRITYPNVQLPPHFKDWLQGKPTINNRLLAHVQRWQEEPRKTQ